LKADYFEPLVSLGGAYLELGRDREAIPPLMRAIELKPGCVEAHDYLGTAYLKNGERAGTMEQLRILKSFDPNFEGALSKQLASENVSGK
jgi:hypothetical protein